MAILDIKKQLTVPLENLSTESWVSYATHGVNTNALNHICVDYNYSQEIKMNGGVHRCSSLSTLLIILKIWCRETIDSRLASAIKVEIQCGQMSLHESDSASASQTHAHWLFLSQPNLGKRSVAKYLGITISDNMDLGQQISEISSKATKTLGFFRRNLAFAPKSWKGSDIQNFGLA